MDETKRTWTAPASAINAIVIAYNVGFSNPANQSAPFFRGMVLIQFYNLVLFISSVAVFSLVAQRMSGNKAIK